MNSAREFHGQGKSPVPSNIAGNFAPRLEMKLTSLGKLSSNGPRFLAGYQMKWPMPNEAKSSPEFHEVRPDTVPLHSFCHTFRPIDCASACDNVIAKTGDEMTAPTRATNVRLPQRELDRALLSISMHPSPRGSVGCRHRELKI